MIKKDEFATPTSCLNKAHDDEPIFVLRANDEFASGIVRLWAERYRTAKLNEQGSLSTVQQNKYHEARNLADKMEVWKTQNIQSTSRWIYKGCLTAVRSKDTFAVCNRCRHIYQDDLPLLGSITCPNCSDALHRGLTHEQAEEKIQDKIILEKK